MSLNNSPIPDNTSDQQHQELIYKKLVSETNTNPREKVSQRDQEFKDKKERILQ